MTSQPEKKPLKTLVEVLIFASPEPLSEAALASHLESEGCDIASISAAISELNDDYIAQGRAFRVIRSAGGWRMMSDPDLMPYVERLNPPKRHKPLTPAAIETLAVIAYKQPITKSRIDSIRGLNSEGVFRTLLERKLVAPAGRSDEPGRPLLYNTTAEFLKAFNLNSLDDLPREKDFPTTSRAHKVE